MKKILIGILTLVLIFSLVLGARKLFFKKDNTEMLLAEQEGQVEEVEEEIEEVKAEVEPEKKEKTIEEIEREIEAKKPYDKIAIKPLKDASTGKEYHELEDAPLQYAIDGVSFTLQDTGEETKDLPKLQHDPTEEDIKRLQGYSYNWYTGYSEKVEPRYKCQEYLEKYPEDAQAVFKKYIPHRIDIYKNASLGWVSDPSLIYETARGYYGVRGILQMSYKRDDNIFKLKANKIYERDVEFRIANTTKGTFLNQVIYLSNWREVYYD